MLDRSGGGSEQEISPALPHFNSDGSGATSSGGHSGTHVEQKLSGAILSQQVLSSVNFEFASYVYVHKI